MMHAVVQMLVRFSIFRHRLKHIHGVQPHWKSMGTIAGIIRYTGHRQKISILLKT